MSRKGEDLYFRAKRLRLWSAPLERRRTCRCKQEDGMRKYLLAGVATLGAAGFAGAAFAQAPAAPPSPTEGTLVTAPSGGPSYANNNNNYQAAALPGPVANPTPGTIVIHVNGKVEVDFQLGFSSADSRTVSAPAGSVGGAAIAAGAATPAATVLGNTGSGAVKISPQ